MSAGKVYKDDVWHTIMTYGMTGFETKLTFEQKSLLSPPNRHGVRQKCLGMKTEDYQVQIEETQEEASLADTVKEWEETCKNCNPLTPITCMSSCKIWKQKNELRKLHTKMENPNFMTNLLNTLKNGRRLQILETISEEGHSITRLQQKLRKKGYFMLVIS